MNLFQLIYAFIKKNLKSVRDIEDSDERKKQWLKLVFWYSTCFRIWRSSCTSRCKHEGSNLCFRNSFYNSVCRISCFEIF